MLLKNWKAAEESDVGFMSRGFEIKGLFGKPLGKEPTAGIVLCHGTTNTMLDCPLMSEMVRALLPAGFATLRFDFYGSGSSPGVMADKKISILLQNLSDAIGFLVCKGIRDIGLFGRSMGGTIALLGSSQKNVRAMVAASAVTHLGELGEKWQVLQRKQEELEKKGEKLAGTGAYKGKFELGGAWYGELDEMSKRLKEEMHHVKNILVLATTPDEKVSLENATDIINAALPPKYLRIFEGTDHGYTGFENQAVELSVEWLNRYVRNLPTIRLN